DGVSSGLVKMTEKIESTMCIPKGLLLAMMEREVTDVLASIVGDPFEQIQQRISSAQTVWGPAQFHDIAWIKTGYGVLGSDAFNGTGVFEFGTKQCLDALGISYDQSAAVHFQDQNADSGVLERSYLGYALCAAAAKLKNDSKTGAGSCTWDQTAVERAAESYLGACSQNGRDYCSVYSETICNLYPNSNPALCSASGDSPDLICKPPQDYLCTDGNIRLLHPLNDLSARVSQPWGGADNHNGVDYAVPAGSPVYAAAPGIVVKMMDHWPDPNASDLENAAGNFVKIRHDQIDGVQTFYTSYQHLNGVSVQVGDRVQAGELIGTSGTTGRSSGPHLHFELRLRDCYDGYGEGDYELGQCSADPTQYILDESGFTNCDKTGENAPIIDGEFTCPVLDPGSARILQTSNGSGSHSRPDISPQKPTDIGAPNHIIVAPVSGTVRIVTPVDTVNTYGGGICDYIRLPDGNPSNDAEINWDVIKQQSLVEDPSGSGIFKRGSITYDSRIDDEGDYYYDGGFVVHITDKDGNLWRLVHVKDLLVANGAVVEVGEPIGKVYDGQLSGEWADWSVKPQDGSGCFSVQYAHLHFAIISADAVENQYYQGNTIDSTPWVQKYCGL
ncbi:M23 family metallopeptidase, partial [Candidatus Dojkabacteria bacterium]|nr:M23 family metallopeptidase [Candidatus Dojkabacteria bacterium]